MKVNLVSKPIGIVSLVVLSLQALSCMGCVIKKNACDEKKEKALNVFRKIKEKQTKKLPKYFDYTLDSQAYYDFNTLSGFLNKYGIPNANNMFCVIVENRYFLAAPFPLTTVKPDKYFKAAFFEFNTQGQIVQLQVLNMSDSSETEMLRQAYIKEFNVDTTIDLNKLIIDSVSNIQVNYLNKKMPCLERISDRDVYSNVGFKVLEVPQLKKSIARLFNYIKTNKAEKIKNDPWSDSFVGDPELLNISLYFKEGNTQNGISLRYIVSDNGIHEKDEEFIIVSYNTKLLYFKKDSELTEILKNIVCSSFLKK